MKFDHRTLTTAMDFQKTKMKHNAQKKKKSGTIENFRAVNMIFLICS